MNSLQPTGHSTQPGASGHLDTLSQIVLQLHRGSRDWPSATFAPRACELLAALLPFDACLWASLPVTAAPGAPPDLRGLYSEGLTQPELSLCLQGQGPTPGLLVAATEPLAARRVELSLWRRHGASHSADFTDPERRTLQFLMPHLVEAQRENRLSRAHDDPGGGSARPRRSLALCDADGVLQQVDEHGLALLRSEWPRWAEARLPDALVRAVAAAATGEGPGSAEPFHGRQVTVLITRSGESLLLEVRRRSMVDRLSTRQRDIALLYVDGMTGPQIATQLGLSPSTVNNHLGVIFKKLAVSNKLQLLAAMRPRA